MVETHKTSSCKFCKKPLILLVTTKGNKVWVDAEGVDENDKIFNWQKHTAHYKNCNKARKTFHRKKKTRVYNNGIPQVTAEQIIQDREKNLKDFREKLARDTRPFIINNQIEITMPRYGYLNSCAELGLGYEELISWTNEQLKDWQSLKYEEGITEIPEPSLFE